MTAKENVLLATLSNDPPGAKVAYKTLKEWYEQEFGLAWVLKEINEARNEVSARIIHHSARLPHSRRVEDAVRYLYQDRDGRGTGKQYFVGVKYVNCEEFRLYAKGLYFMAAYLMLND